VDTVTASARINTEVVDVVTVGTTANGVETVDQLVVTPAVMMMEVVVVMEVTAAEEMTCSLTEEVHRAAAVTIVGLEKTTVTVAAIAMT
jgi:hypothetical protein